MISLFYNHILLEAYCLKEDNNCKFGFQKINIKCFNPNCRYLSLVPCANELAITDNDGISSYWIAFGGDMENDTLSESSIEKWNKICKEKIDEAYREYMDML